MEDLSFHRGTKNKALVGERYELGEEIGRGAFGQVFKATCVKDGNVVAIKQISLSGMSPDRLVDIMQEIDLLKKLNHENIVKYIESFKTRSHLHIVLEYMEQGALSQLKDKWGVLKEFLISAFISQVLHGLEYLHAQGVVHRDVKGANILLGAQVCLLSLTPRSCTVLHGMPVHNPAVAHIFLKFTFLCAMLVPPWNPKVRVCIAPLVWW